METLYERLQRRKHLSSSTFRYSPEELAAMESIHKELEEQKPGRISKNDIARLGLMWLIEDYYKNEEASLLAQILARM